MEGPSWIPPAAWSFLDIDEREAIEEMITALQTHDLIKNKKERCNKKLSTIILFIGDEFVIKKRRAYLTGLFITERYVCLNMSLLKRVTAFSKSFLSNHFTELGYSTPKSCKTDFVAHDFPEITTPIISKQWMLRYKLSDGLPEGESRITTKCQYSDALVEEFRARLVKILNIGAISNKKAGQLICLIKDPRYESIPPSLMATMPLLSQSFFYRHKKEISFCDNRKGHSGRKSLLFQQEEAKIIEICTARRHEMRVVSLRWTAAQIETLYSIRVSLTYVHNLFTRFNWRSIRVQSQHPDQIDPIVETLVVNFFSYIWDFIIENRISPCNFHIMDETGLYSNTLPRTTYAPKGEGGFCVTDKNSIKDTAVVTLTANNAGHLFYVPTIGEEVKTIKGKIVKFKKRSGVGNKEMIEWCKSFLQYASPGDLLILDNLSSHKNMQVQAILRSFGIHYEFFPVRCAFILSVLDNAFFAALKNNVSYLEEHDSEKLADIKRVFLDMIKRKIPSAFFKHCNYDAIFDSASYEFEEKCIESVVTTIPERDENYGVFQIPEEPTVECLLGHHVGAVYDSARCSISSVLYFIYESEYMKCILSYADDPICASILGIANSIGSAKKIQLKRQRPLFFDLLESKGLTDKIDAGKNAFDFLTFVLKNANYQIVIDKFSNQEEMHQSFQTCIEINQSRSLEYSLKQYFNIDCEDGRDVKVIHSTDEYEGSLPEVIVFKVNMKNPMEQFSYPEKLDMSLFNLLGKPCIYALKGLFANNINNDKNGITLYMDIRQTWFGFHSKPFVTNSNHVFKRLKADIGYGRAFIFIYEKAEERNTNFTSVPLTARENFVKWIPTTFRFTIPIVTFNNSKSPGGLRARIIKKLDSIINSRMQTRKQQFQACIPMPAINIPMKGSTEEINLYEAVTRSNKAMLEESVSPIDENTEDVNNDCFVRHERISLTSESGKAIDISSSDDEYQNVEISEDNTSDDDCNGNNEDTSSVIIPVHEYINEEDKTNGAIPIAPADEGSLLCKSMDARVRRELERATQRILPVDLPSIRIYEFQLSEKYKYTVRTITHNINGINNKGNYCYINTTLHLLSLIPEVRAMFDIGYENPLLKAIGAVLHELSIPLRDPIEISDFFPSEKYNHQTDLYEFITEVFELMQYRTFAEQDSQNGSFTNEMRRYFKIECKRIDGVPRMDDVVINLIIIEYKTVAEALNGFFAFQTITYIPKYLLISLNRMRIEAETGKELKIYKRIIIDKVLLFKQRLYYLAAIITHTGNKVGHFVIYIKDKEKWICCNDKKVYVVEEEEINDLIEGDDYIEEHRYEKDPSQTIIDIADTMRTANFLLYVSTAI